MKFLTLLLFTFLSIANAYSEKEISINHNLTTKQSLGEFESEVGRIEIRHEGLVEMEEAPSQVKKLGDCLVIEYTRKEPFSRANHGHGNVYLYSISGSKQISTIEDTSMSWFFDTSTSRSKEKSALLLSTTESFIDEQYEINGDCGYKKIDKIPDIYQFSGFERNGKVYLEGTCPGEISYCMVTYYKGFSTLYNIYNK